MASGDTTDASELLAQVPVFEALEPSDLERVARAFHVSARTLMRRVKAAGWSVMYNPCTTVVHIGGESAKSEGALTGGRQIAALQAESEWLYFRKHYGVGGVVAELTLTAIADALVALKSVWKRRSLRGLADASSTRLRSVWPAFRRTSGGRVPAR